MAIRDERGRPLVAELETWLSGAARQALLQEQDRQGDPLGTSACEPFRVHD
jgi:hypothetical protein